MRRIEQVSIDELVKRYPVRRDTTKVSETSKIKYIN